WTPPSSFSEVQAPIRPFLYTGAPGVALTGMPFGKTFLLEMLACTRRRPENPAKWLSSTYLRYSRGAAIGEATSEEGKGRLEGGT
ncbi:MAG TPA: hypothetical protein VII86_08690, partial [Thermoanaerobaculia bacterium]